MHAAQLLADEEYYVAKDMCADYLELRSSMAHGVVVALHSSEGVGRLHSLVGLFEGNVADAGFARQARRKYLSQ